MSSHVRSIAARRLLSFWLLLIPFEARADVVLTESQDLNVDVSQAHGRIALNLQGGIWTLAEYGGQAELLADAEYRLAHPRWSPDGNWILYQSESPSGSGLWNMQVATRAIEPVVSAEPGLRDGDWHPDADRVVFAAARDNGDYDIWEIDLPTGLQWRLTNDPGDETEPTWSDNGRHLAYIAENDGQYALMLRRFGQPAEPLVISDVPLSSPSWRPDGSLLVFQRHGAEGTTLEMAILSEPVLVRMIESRETLSRAPVSWRDRMQMFYGANSQVRKRGFEDRRSTPVHFRAILASPPPAVEPVIVPRQLEIFGAPDNRLIIRAARMFDGIGSFYREDVDILVENGRIAAIGEIGEHEDITVLDLGNVTVIPGMIDALASFDDSVSIGSAMLAYGVTTIVSDNDEPSFETLAWEGENSPGPRFLPAATSGSPALPAEALSNIATLGTPGVAALFESRQARALGHRNDTGRRSTGARRSGSSLARVAASSKGNRMPAGLGLHAELRALAGAGLTGAQVLRTTGKSAARLLGLENQLGVILPGAAADLVLINGDPLGNVDDLVNVVAVVRNGRFFSLVTLLERSKASTNVE